jgi:hypothetical protein
MNFSEFKQLLGADPHNRDPAFLHARDSSPEFREAAAQADRFEAKLERAVAVDLPKDLFAQIGKIPLQVEDQGANRSTWWPVAIAASLLLVIGAAGLSWKMSSPWNTVQEYVVDHYRHDGPSMLARTGEDLTTGVREMLAPFGIDATPQFAGIVDVMKVCPTPDGKGLHMILVTERGPITVIYMPGTSVTDGERLVFDDKEATLVLMPKGSAAIVGGSNQQVSDFHGLVQNGIYPLAGNT